MKYENCDFTGKVLQIWLKGPAKGSFAQNVVLRRIGERDFLVGQLPDKGDGSDPRVGLSLWFALDEVEMIIEYPDLQTARNAFAILERQERTEEKSNRWRFW
jgi:hypothetical protein